MESSEARHARIAERLNRAREVGVRPLCMPSYVAVISWSALTLARFAWHGAVPLWGRLLHLVAAVSTLLSPVSVAIAIVLTAVSSKHRPFPEVRNAWIFLVASLACTGIALAALAHNMPKP